jgi:hypothetical protein
MKYSLKQCCLAGSCWRGYCSGPEEEKWCGSDSCPFTVKKFKNKHTFWCSSGSNKKNNPAPHSPKNCSNTSLPIPTYPKLTPRSISLMSFDSFLEQDLPSFLFTRLLSLLLLLLYFCFLSYVHYISFHILFSLCFTSSNLLSLEFP